MWSRTSSTWKSSILLLITTSVIADTLPSVNSIPVLIINNSKYYDASMKAQEALLLQMGLTQKYMALSSYVDKRVRQVASVAERGIKTTIQKYTPLNPSYVVSVAATGYTVLIKKEFTVSFPNPAFNDITHTITINQSTTAVNMSVPF